MTKKQFLIYFTLALLVLMASGCSKSESKKEIIKISANQLIDEFTDAKSGNHKYKGRQLRISGKIYELNTAHSNDTKSKLPPTLRYITFEKNGTDIQVQCFLSESQKDKFNTLEEGKDIVIEGTCKGKLSDDTSIVLMDCEVVETK